MTQKLLPVSDPDDANENERGNTVKTWFVGPNRERYYWDFGPCGPGTGWKQYDTSQDAHYFGVWVHPETRRTLTFAEGDLTLVECPTLDTFRAELDNAAEFYGDPPPAFRVVDRETGQVTHFYDKRPSAD
jgi:hypothetical protein